MLHAVQKGRRKYDRGVNYIYIPLDKFKSVLYLH